MWPLSGHSGHGQIGQALAEVDAGADPHIRMHAVLEDTQGDDLAHNLQRIDEALSLAVQLEFAGVALKARLLRAHALSRAGRIEEAAEAMRELVPLVAQVQPADIYFGQVWWIAAQVFDASGDGDQALMALAQGAQWVRRVALPHVPEAFRNSFLQRNPSNRALLAAADRKHATR